jgi:hypothetical protein
MYSLAPAAGGCAVTGSHRGGHHWPDTSDYSVLPITICQRPNLVCKYVHRGCVVNILCLVFTYTIACSFEIYDE